MINTVLRRRATGEDRRGKRKNGMSARNTLFLPSVVWRVVLPILFLSCDRKLRTSIGQGKQEHGSHFTKYPILLEDTENVATAV